jgi:RNA polymerase sigma-70 factor, ECF subfamily
MTNQDRTNQFLRLLMANQRSLYAFIRAQVRTRPDADEILQQTTAVLWEKFDTFRQCEDFARWACGVAWREVLQHARNRRRQRLLAGEQLAELLTDRLLVSASQVDRRLDMLKACLDMLPPASRRLIDRRYLQQESVDDIAARQRQSASNIYKALAKIRDLLLRCVERKLREEN